MKSNNYLQSIERFFPVFIFFIFLSCLSSCKPDKKPTERNDKNENVIEVRTENMDFQLPDTILSGWNTFKYINNSPEPHFFIFEKMPNGIGIKNYQNELIPPFIAAFLHFDKGNIDDGIKELKEIPEWFYKVELGGGVGITSPYTTTESTIFLEPGVYVMECYVRMPNGMAHAFMGMIEELVVKEERNNLQRPVTDFKISLSSTEGITFLDSIKTGDYSIGVNFKDQKQYETMLGHDINLVKLEDISLLDTLNSWINAANIKAFRTPAPKGLTFLGGVEDLPAGSTGYFSVTLSEGNYVLISEIPNAVERNMFKLLKVY